MGFGTNCLRWCKRCARSVVVGSLCVVLATEGVELSLLRTPAKVPKTVCATKAAAEEPKQSHAHTEANTEPIRGERPPLAASGAIMAGPTIYNGSGAWDIMSGGTAYLSGGRNVLTAGGMDGMPLMSGGARIIHGPPLRSGGA